MLNLLARALKPFVNNFRMGLATNSSSSHSMVYFKTDRPGHNTIDHASSVDTEFGWGQFELDTLGEKLMYALVACLSQNGYNGWYKDEDDRPSLTQAFQKYGPQFPEFSQEEFTVASQGYIDHQSQHPWEELLLAARDPKIEFWGGNDNGGDPHDSWSDNPVNHGPDFIKYDRMSGY